MAKKSASLIALWLVPASLILPLQMLRAAALPKSMHEIVNKLKLNPAILADVDKELQVPKDWIEKARKEGKLRVRSTPITPAEIKTLYTPFNERYPFIAVENSGVDQEDRTIKTLVAYRAGRVVTDAVTSVGGYISAYRDARALEDLRDIPTWKNIPEGAKDAADGLWVGTAMHHWCLSYNTKLVKKEDLPKKWEDLLTNPRWRGGNLALGNRPQLWALNLWNVKGEKWTKDFISRLLTEVKPQIRKEGLGALVELAAAGEFHAVFPSNARRVFQRALEGAPVGYNCPEPAPAAVEELIVLKGSPNSYSAKLFVNWLLSREGQIAQYAAKYYTPAHKDLGLKELTPFAEEILGKDVSYRDPGLELELTPKLIDFWNGLVLRGTKAR